MKTRFMLEDPGKIEATMKITMPLNAWERLRDQLRGIPCSWPACDLVRDIDDLFSQARKVYYPNTIDEEAAE